MDGKKGGSKQGEFSIGQVFGLSFHLRGSHLSLTQKQNKHAGVWMVIEMA